MTSENKLSIVIAFGLLIFVGMLVADHFSIASQREVAELRFKDSPPPPLVGGGIDVIPGPPTPRDSTTDHIGDLMHTVRIGETLNVICKEHYGDSGLARSVALWNNINNPNEIERGTQIALPSRYSLIANSMVQTQQQTTVAITQSKMGTYKVKKGDTLSEIAQKIMGTTRKTQLLIDLNKDVMPNPNNIRPGMILKYPL
ncbi:MAG: LysM peptidoglycan-binding domain-containing protein [Phycisphaerae bacterium]|jgi:nucleoid-associated protein YgaU|nr:LysM peptidoglycan-binding domain-containing protein [Phycisphaerae bacterium]